MPDPVGLFLTFLKAASLSLGGLSALPLVRADLVVPGIATDEQVVQAIAIGRVSTGPTGLWIVSLGYLVGGIAGAIAALIAASLPPLVVVPLAVLARRWLLTPPVAGLVRGVGLATAGLLAATGLQLLSASGATAWWQLALAVAGVALSLRGGIHPASVIVLGGVAGLILGR